MATRGRVVLDRTRARSAMPVHPPPRVGARPFPAALGGRSQDRARAPRPRAGVRPQVRMVASPLWVHDGGGGRARWHIPPPNAALRGAGMRPSVCEVVMARRGERFKLKNALKEAINHARLFS